MRIIWIIAIALVIGGFAGLYIGYVRHPVTPVANSTASIGSSSPKTAVLSASMRTLLEDRIIWTRMYLIDTASNDGFATADTDRLMKNQEAIGNAMKPYYGDSAGSTATNLLKQDISNMVAFAKAAKAQDSAAENKASTQWTTSSDQTADFLTKQNPNWSTGDIRFALRSYVDVTKQEAVDIFSDKYDASISDYDTLQKQVLQTADALSLGIMQQFPDRF